jgi:hypothetical protein
VTIKDYNKDKFMLKMFFLVLSSILLTGCTLISYTWPPRAESDCKASLPQGKSVSDCYMFLAEEEKDIRLCDKVSDSQKQICLDRVGYQNDPISSCESLPVGESRDTCLFGVVTNDPFSNRAAEACTKIQCGTECGYPAARDYCFTNLAVYRKDRSFCDKAGSLYKSCDERTKPDR